MAVKYILACTVLLFPLVCRAGRVKGDDVKVADYDYGGGMGGAAGPAAKEKDAPQWNPFAENATDPKVLSFQREQFKKFQKNSFSNWQKQEYERWEKHRFFQWQLQEFQRKQLAHMEKLKMSEQEFMKEQDEEMKAQQAKHQGWLEKLLSGEEKEMEDVEL